MRSVFISILCTLTLCLLLTETKMTYKSVSFYTQAHQDDWQLFRGEQVWEDINTVGNKVVFIYATAGDAGQKDGWWEAREKGALASVRKILNAPSPLTTKVKYINRHPIVLYSCGNTESYFMRLPDGYVGNGF